MAEVAQGVNTSTGYSHEPSPRAADCVPLAVQQSAQSPSERSGALPGQTQSVQSLRTSGTQHQTPAGATLAESQSWLPLVYDVAWAGRLRYAPASHITAV